MNGSQKSVPYNEVVRVQKQVAEAQEKYCRAVVHPRERTKGSAGNKPKPTYVLCDSIASYYVFVDEAEDMRVAICSRHNKIAPTGRLKVKTSRR
jgi:hypothetical protein